MKALLNLVAFSLSHLLILDIKLCLGLFYAENQQDQISSRSMEMDTTIQVRQRGTLTLPAELRERYGIKKGDTFRLVDLDGIFVLTRMVSLVPELAREIEKARREAGLSTEELLQGLREQRERYVAEKYGRDEK
jgi:bifunctional DNA-binding transcriptional regulator/antitoxin component of YhaV-PrlF toxin-antitoxin module